MLTKYFLLICFPILLILPKTEMVDSRGKQQKFFPKELKNKDVYLGMTLEKFKKERPLAIVDTTISVFKIKYTEPAEITGILSYTYLLTQTDTPQLYSIEIEYDVMDKVRSHAIATMGEPNYNGEWRMERNIVKEDFMMGAWTFGQKLVYGGTVEGSEWEKGFEN